jgi:LuxR family maltose regulon positive regulatory protein
METPLLQTKLYIPPVRPELVSRPRLIKRLDEGLRLGCKLTLISAPAGFGKTTLVTEWLDGADRPRTWLSLDENDNDPARFFTYLVAALQRIDPSIGQTAQAMSQSPQPPPPDTLLASLINDMAATPHPFLLVLDDYHLIHTLPIHQQLAFLLEHQPPQVHLVIATREDLPLPLSRLRARGEMVEIREPDLRFTAAETAEFLERIMSLELSAADISALHRRTEGWIAGLQLAACSLQESEDAHRLVESFTGSHRYILDYLIEEVFQQQPDDVQDFLLKTSILDRFTAPLCDAVRFGRAQSPSSSEATAVRFGRAQSPSSSEATAVRFGKAQSPSSLEATAVRSGRAQSPSSSAATADTGRENSREVLLALEQANLFIVPLDESRQWYRYHRLFADLLRHRLEVEETPSTLASLHQRASQWYEAEGYLADAVSHALTGSDWDRATSLILSASVRLLQRGEVVTLLNWFQALPEEVVRTNPQLCSGYSWPLILTEQIDTAEFYLARAEEDAREDTSLLGDIAVARAYIARMRGDHQRAQELSERALSLLPDDDLSARSVVGLNLGLAQWHTGRLAQAEQTLMEAQRAAQGSGNDYVRVTAIVFLGRIEAARGRLHLAAESCRQAIQGGGQLPIVAVAHIDLTKLLYEWNDLEAAAHHLRQGLELSRRSGGVEFQVSGYTTLALLKQSQGEASAAQDALRESAQLLEHPGVSPPTQLYNLACRVLIALAQGDTGAATHLAEQFPAPEEVESFPARRLIMLARARLLLAQDERAAAAEQLESLHRMASRADWETAFIETRALQALAATTPEEALAFLTEALKLAEPEGYVRTFIDLGEPMAELLHRAESRDTDSDYVSQLLTAFDAGGLRTREAGEIEGSPAPPPPGSLALIEPLSERELEVLGLLVEGQTYQEIAQSLYVSINTVKTHLKNIYGKLGVSNRREATAKAKELNLLP